MPARRPVCRALAASDWGRIVACLGGRRRADFPSGTATDTIATYTAGRKAAGGSDPLGAGTAHGPQRRRPARPNLRRLGRRSMTLEPRCPAAPMSGADLRPGPAQGRGLRGLVRAVTWGHTRLRPAIAPWPRRDRQGGHAGAIIRGGRHCACCRADILSPPTLSISCLNISVEQHRHPPWPGSQKCAAFITPGNQARSPSAGRPATVRRQGLPAPTTSRSLAACSPAPRPGRSRCMCLTRNAGILGHRRPGH